ncbi:MAG: alpha/beta fold hydrolase [Acidimicrobiia bacterium]|nr:alpha/beta fold hydrolase [Acidimicrobiia bacterium]
MATRQGGLWVRTHGPGPAQVVALHGFTQHGGMFEHLAAVSGITIAAPDLPGHGRTQVDPVTIGTAVDAVSDLLATFPEPPLVLGYSQGGRVALQVALTRSDLVGALVLVSASAGLSERARQLRRAADEGLADRIERIGTERFINEWLANPLVATNSVAPELREADRLMRLTNSADGLAAALRGMGQAAVANSSERIPALPMPVVFMAGTEDEGYSNHAAEMAAGRNERPVLIDGASHNVILEAPEAVARVINELLTK